MESVLILAEQNIKRLEADKAKIASELSAKELEYKKSIEPLAKDLEAVEANIAEYEAIRSRFIADLHKAIRLKLIDIICVKFTPEFITGHPCSRSLGLWHRCNNGALLSIVYDRYNSRINVRLRRTYGDIEKNIWSINTSHKDVNEHEFALYLREHLKRLKLYIYDHLPTDHEGLNILCYLLGIEY